MRIVLLILALGAAPYARTQNSNPPVLSAEQRKLNLESLEKVWTTVRDQHWDPDLGGVNWTAAREAALVRLQVAGTMEQSRAVMRDMLAKLGLSHFAIIPSEVYEEIQLPSQKSTAASGTDGKPTGLSRDAGRKESAGVGMETAIVDSKVRVTAIESDSPAARAGVRMGWEVVSAGDVSFRRIVEALNGASLAEREVLERAFLEDVFLGPQDEAIEVVFRDREERLHSLVLNRAEPRGSLARFGYLPQTRVWIEMRRPEERIVYIRFNIFLDPERLMPAFENAVRGCLQCQGFIIDLRGNPGGIGAMAMGMSGWFVNRRGRKLGTLRARDYTFDFDVNPRGDTFDGPLAILVDGASASTSEIMAAGLQDLGRAHVFGTRTAGAALPSVFIRLPNSDGFQYANATYVSRNGTTLEGAGVTPDVIVRHTTQSLLAGHDAVLDAAVQWIQSKP